MSNHSEIAISRCHSARGGPGRAARGAGERAAAAGAAETLGRRADAPHPPAHALRATGEDAPDSRDPHPLRCGSRDGWVRTRSGGAKHADARRAVSARTSPCSGRGRAGSARPAGSFANPPSRLAATSPWPRRMRSCCETMAWLAPSFSASARHVLLALAERRDDAEPERVRDGLQHLGDVQRAGRVGGDGRDDPGARTTTLTHPGPEVRSPRRPDERGGAAQRLPPPSQAGDTARPGR